MVVRLPSPKLFRATAVLECSSSAELDFLLGSGEPLGATDELRRPAALGARDPAWLGARDMAGRSSSAPERRRRGESLEPNKMVVWYDWYASNKRLEDELLLSSLQ